MTAPSETTPQVDGGAVSHTAGPWENHGSLIIAAAGETVCAMPHYFIGIANPAMGDPAEANALLIAEAPRLLEALDALLKERSVNTLEEAAREYPHGKEDVIDVLKVFDDAREAIAKARGAQS